MWPTVMSNFRNRKRTIQAYYLNCFKRFCMLVVFRNKLSLKNH